MNPGEVLDGRYEITARLGAGGMGEVYKARHTFLGASRVIKVVHPHIAGNTDARDRFLREARVAEKVQHPNVATLHDFASLPDGAHYMVWEFIDGENLAQRLRQAGTLPPRQAVSIAVQALHGLEAIHRAGIVHRDISPENLMLAPDGSVKIIDLGVAKMDDPEAVSQTRTGIFVGKLRYAAPEQLGFLPEGEKIDGRADIYALAMVIVEMLTGRPPYEAKSPHEYFLHHAKEIPMTTVELPAGLPGSEALQQVLQKALARNRDERWASAHDFAVALQDIEKTLPDPKTTATIAMGFDADATWTPSDAARETARTPAPILTKPAEPTVRTDVPLPPPAPMAETIKTPLPAPPAPPVAAAPPLKSSSTAVVAIVIIALLMVLGGGAVGAYMFRSQIKSYIFSSTATKKPDITPHTVTTTPTNTAPQKTSESSVVVTPSQQQQTATTITPAVITETAPKRKTPVQVAQVEPPSTDTAPPVETTESAAPLRKHPALYIDAPGRRRGNNRALDRLHDELRGVTQVGLVAGSDQVMVYRTIHRYLPDLTFDADSPVMIKFGSTAQRLGYDSQGFGSTVVIEKNGRVIFRYNLPSGDRQSAADAFAQTLAEAFQEP